MNFYYNSMLFCKKYGLLWYGELLTYERMEKLLRRRLKYPKTAKKQMIRSMKKHLKRFDEKLRRIADKLRA